MELTSPEWVQRKTVKMLSTSKGSRSGGGVSRRQTEVLSGMIVWNVLLLALLVLAVCVQGERGSAPSDIAPHLEVRRSAKSVTVKKDEAGSPGPAKSVGNPAPPPQSTESNVSQQPKGSDSQGNRDSSEEAEEKSGEEEVGGGDKETQPSAENKGSSANATTKDDAGDGLFQSHLPNMSTDAVLRGFYVFVGIGAIILVYIVIKMARLRKRRAAGKYRVLSHSDDQEMFPLAAGEGEDEEIFNAAHHQSRK